jgi:hypothetical protein
VRLAPLLLALALLSPAAGAAPPAPAIPLPWAKGTTLHYTSTTVDEKVTRGVRRVSTTHADTTIEIIEATPQGFVQVWRDTDPTIAIEGEGETSAAEQRAAQVMLDQVGDIAVEAQLDAKGVFTGLRNAEALGAKMREVMLPGMRAAFQARPEYADATEQALDAKLGPVLARLTTPAALNVTLGRQPTIYNLFTAPAITADHPVTYEDVLQSPVSDDRLPSVGKFELVGTDAAADTVTIRWTQTIDPVKGVEAAWRMLAAITGQPLPVERNALPQQLKLTDEATVVVHRRTGVPQHLVHVRDVGLGSTIRRTTWTFALAPEPAEAK